MKKILSVLTLLTLLTLFAAACGGSTTNNTSTAVTVNLTSDNFAQSSITINKGESISLVDQAGAVHIISNGSWENNTPDPQTESGAPVVNNVMFNSPNQTEVIGPFNTVGTFHFYCSVHTGMNLAVTVQ